MMKKGNRILTVFACLIVAGLFLFPTVQWYFFTGEETKKLAEFTRDQIRSYAEGKGQQTTAYLIAEAKNNGNSPVSLEYAFAAKLAKENYKIIGKKMPEVWTYSDVISGFNSKSSLQNALEAHYLAEIRGIKGLKDGILNLGLDLSGGMSVAIKVDMESLKERNEDKELTAEQREDAVLRALEILNNRIDTFGLTEPQIRRDAGGERIFIDIPGEPNPEVAQSFLQGKGSLFFHIENTEATAKLYEYISQNPNEAFDIYGKLQLPEGFLDPGLAVLNQYEKDKYGDDVFVRRLVVHTEAKYKLDGQHIESAAVQADQTDGRPNVVFQLSPEGAETFFTLTQANVDKMMAVVMDGKIKSRANISEPIPGGSVRVSGFDLKEAKDLERVLQTAALPVDLVIENSQEVGASLGEAAKNAGLNAIFLGFILVIVFMIVYYKGSGIIADIALLLNLVFIFALLSALKTTLTLTSIAGIILTVGMAVDANVIIFERIKEERRLGKSAAASIEAGFKKAFWTIMDANITTIVAAVFLSTLGKGTIKGFAFTLMVGIFSSMFTALFVSRLLFDLTQKKDKLSISWRLK